jgi:hypothetical protein
MSQENFLENLFETHDELDTRHLYSVTLVDVLLKIMLSNLRVGVVTIRTSDMSYSDTVQFVRDKYNEYKKIALAIYNTEEKHFVCLYMDSSKILYNDPLSDNSNLPDKIRRFLQDLRLRNVNPKICSERLQRHENNYDCGPLIVHILKHFVKHKDCRVPDISVPKLRAQHFAVVQTLKLQYDDEYIWTNAEDIRIDIDDISPDRNTVDIFETEDEMKQEYLRKTKILYSRMVDDRDRDKLKKMKKSMESLISRNTENLLRTTPKYSNRMDEDLARMLNQRSLNSNKSLAPYTNDEEIARYLQQNPTPSPYNKRRSDRPRRPYTDDDEEIARYLQQNPTPSPRRSYRNSNYTGNDEEIARALQQDDDDDDDNSLMNELRRELSDLNADDNYTNDSPFF